MALPNFSSDNDYAYTDEDFARATQSYWVGLKTELDEQQKEENDSRNWTPDDYGDDDHEELESYQEPDPQRLPDMDYLDSLRDRETGHYPEEPRFPSMPDDYEVLPEEVDMWFEGLGENRTPEGWPDTFYEY